MSAGFPDRKSDTIRVTRRRQVPDEFTCVDLTWVEGKIEYWIRFGHAAGTQFLDQHRRIVLFDPGAVFAFIRWEANGYGTILSCIDILRAVSPGEAYQTIPYVRPGAEILLKNHGWPKVEEVLSHVDRIETLGIDPAETDPDHWHHVAHWMQAGETPRTYTRMRHQAWLRIREIAP